MSNSDNFEPKIVGFICKWCGEAYKTNRDLMHSQPTRRNPELDHRHQGELVRCVCGPLLTEGSRILGFLERVLRADPQPWRHCHQPHIISESGYQDIFDMSTIGLRRNQIFVCVPSRRMSKKRLPGGASHRSDTIIKRIVKRRAVCIRIVNSRL